MSKEALLESLKEYDTEIKNSKIIIRTEENRTLFLEELSSKLEGASFLDPRKTLAAKNYSSAGAIKVSGFTIVAKQPRGLRAGVSAGGKLTEIAESAQCYYCAAKWHTDTIDTNSLRLYSSYVQANISVDETIELLPGTWVHSCLTTAEVMHSLYGDRTYIFHRGSAFSNQINNTFLTLNRKERLFSNINKWSPADIWLVEKDLDVVFEFENFTEFNTFLLDKAKSKQLFGVSLKMSKDPKVAEINFVKSEPTRQFMHVTAGGDKYFNTKAVHIYFDDNGKTGDIQFRNFPTTWQGEIKGRLANHGKISGVRVVQIINSISKIKMESPSDIEQQLGKKKFWKKFYMYYSEVNETVLDFDTFRSSLNDKDMHWIVSKYLGTQLVYILQQLKTKKKHTVVSNILSYAKSQSEYSAPHIKVH